MNGMNMAEIHSCTYQIKVTDGAGACICTHTCSVHHCSIKHPQAQGPFPRGRSRKTGQKLTSLCAQVLALQMKIQKKLVWVPCCFREILDSIHRKVIRAAFFNGADDFFSKVNKGESAVTWKVKVYFTSYLHRGLCSHY